MRNWRRAGDSDTPRFPDPAVPAPFWWTVPCHPPTYRVWDFISASRSRCLAAPSSPPNHILTESRTHRVWHCRSPSVLHLHAAGIRPSSRARGLTWAPPDPLVAGSRTPRVWEPVLIGQIAWDVHPGLGRSDNTTGVVTLGPSIHPRGGVSAAA